MKTCCQKCKCSHEYTFWDIIDNLKEDPKLLCPVLNYSISNAPAWMKSAPDWIVFAPDWLKQSGDFIILVQDWIVSSASSNEINEC